MIFERRSSFRLSHEPAQRIRSFLGSPERLSPTHNINNYWLDRRMSLNFTLEPDSVVITGDSNLSSRITPRQHKFLARLPLLPAVAAIARVIKHLSYRIAYQASRIVELSEARRKLAGGSRIRDYLVESAPFGLPEVLRAALKSAPFNQIYDGWPERASLMLNALNVIQHYAPISANSRLHVLEIGSGPAILAGLMAYCLGSKHVLVDLPEQIVVGFWMLAEFFPQQKVALPNEVTALGTFPADCDIVFITPEQAMFLEDHSFDVAVNMFSFQEMAYETIGEYFSLIRRRLAPRGIFYCANRISKFNPHDGTTSEFARYPWVDQDEFLFDRDMDSVFGAASDYRECVVRMAPVA